MLDLKAKLASAGLVSQDDIDRIDQKKAKRRDNRNKRAGNKRAHTPADDIKRVVASLREKPKGDAYEAVRKWVDRVRLDGGGVTPTASSTAFHFAESTGKVGRLYLEETVAERVRKGAAGIVAYMSNHGLAHAVVPALDAKGIADLFPIWLRLLDGDDRAGAIEKKP